MNTSVMSRTPSDEAGHGNRRAVDCARGVRGHEQDHLGERLRRHPAPRIGSGHVGAVLRRVDDAGQYAVDVDAFVAELSRHALGNPDYRAFRRAVRAHIRFAAKTRDGSDIDNLSAPRGEHLRHDRACGVDHRFGVEIEHELPDFFRSLVNRLPHAEAAGDIAENVDPLKPNGRQRLTHGRCVEQIGGHQELALIVAPKGGPQDFVVEVDQDQGGARRREGRGNGTAQIARRTRDQTDFAFECHGVGGGSRPPGSATFFELAWPDFAQYSDEAFASARASASSNPGAIDAEVPASTWWWSMPSNLSQLCCPMVSAMKQPSSTSSGSLKCLWRRSQKTSSVFRCQVIASAYASAAFWRSS